MYPLPIYDPRAFTVELDQGEQTGVTTVAVELGDGRVNYVNVQCPLFDFAGVANAINIFVGTGKRQRWILRPGENTGWLPVASLNDVSVRAASGSVNVPFFMCRLTAKKGCNCD
jgi:hypothetical protein